MRRMFMAAAATAVAAAGAFTPVALAETITVRDADVVRQAHGTSPTAAWVLFSRGAGDAQFVEGPGDAPLGHGSLQLHTPLTVAPAASSKVYLFNYEQRGTPLADLDAISYETNRTSAYTLQSQPFQTAALNMEIDYNGPEVAGGYAILIYEPVYNNGNAAQALNTWASHDAIRDGAARWWTATAGVPGFPQSSAYLPWNQILQLFPEATVGGGFGVNQGGGNDTLVSAVDVLTIGDTTFDFEPVPPPPVYHLSAFQAPVDSDARNSAKAGQNVPVKLLVTDEDGQPVTSDPGLTLTSQAGGSECGGTGAVDAIETYAASSGTWMHQGDGIWQFNWKTVKAWAGTCRTLTVDVAESDTTEQTAGFLFK